MNNSVANDPAVTSLLRQGKVIAYPTEAVFGLGCDPDNPGAVDKILAIKQRPVSKGLILIAAKFDQLKPYIDHTRLSQAQWQSVMDTWPGPTTWVMPASIDTPRWITGNFDTVAVRVTNHPVVIDLCNSFGKPLVSTSANLSGQPAINDINDLQHKLGDLVDAIVQGEVDPRAQPSRIIDAMSGVIYRS